MTSDLKAGRPFGEMRVWDADDPFDAMAESFRLQVATMAIDAGKVTIYRELDPIQQLQCFMAGTVTALIGVCFASIEPAGRDGMMQAIADYLPQARENVEEILKENDATARFPNPGGT